tara:strand:- start:46 stop:828 length:783 start_codon:yes stop_codon:yes gene_type:complete
MSKIESTKENVVSKPFTYKQKKEAIDEFNAYVEKEIEDLRSKNDENSKNRTSKYEDLTLVNDEISKNKTSIIEAFCSTHGISYNTFQKFLNYQKISKKQELRIRSGIDRHFVGCHCHYIKEKELSKTLRNVLKADHIILEARWQIDDKEIKTIEKQIKIISKLKEAREIGKKIITPGLDTEESMRLTITFLKKCDELEQNVCTDNFYIHIGKVASFKQNDLNKISPDHVSYIVCVNSVRPERETLSPEEFSFVPDFEKAI